MTVTGVVLTTVVLFFVFIFPTISKGNLNESTQTEQYLTDLTARVLPSQFNNYNCAFGTFVISSSILNKTGFVNTTHVYDSRFNVDDLTLEPNSNATMTFLVKNIKPYDGELINNTSNFIHYENVTVPQKSTWKNSTLSNGTVVPGFQACYKTPLDEQYGGQECYGGPGLLPPSTITINAMMYNHTGVTISFVPQYEMLEINKSITVEATIHTSTNAVKGTYSVTAPRGFCEGGVPFLLTIGEKPFSP